MKNFIKNYLDKFRKTFTNENLIQIEKFCKLLKKTIKNKKNVFICGNGGSAANAIHMSNDINLILTKKKYISNVEALSSNQAILTCIANDFGYEKIFSEQIKIKGKRGDLLICLSGSGNSSNIIYAIKEANRQSMTTFCFLGYDGGNAKSKTKHFFHFKNSDMQHAEDSQILINHICSKWLKINL